VPVTGPAFALEPTGAAPRAVGLSTIDADDGFYRMSHAFDTRALAASIRFSGLLHPLILEPRAAGPGPRIVSGYRRYRACRELGLATVPAVFASGPPEPLYEAVLLENLSHRAFNPVEVSLALNRLVTWVPREAVIRSWLPALGLHPSPRLLDTALAVSGLEEEIRAALLDGTLNPGDVPALLRWPGPERVQVFRLFRDLNVGTNLRREIALNLFEIQQRDGVPPSVFLAREEVRRAVEDPDRSVPQKARAVRDIVRRSRYPLLTSLEESFSGRSRALRLPPSIAIRHPPFFEGGEYTCTITFRSGREFRECVGRLHDIRDETILPEEDHR